MPVLPIVTYNDPVLREKTQPIDTFDEETKELIKDMFDTMYNSDGIGLAAPQVGISKSIL